MLTILILILGIWPINLFAQNNMNTGTVQEAVEWMQYTNYANGTSYLGQRISRDSLFNFDWQFIKENLTGAENPQFDDK